MKPRFLSLEQVLAIHADQIDRYGGSLGVGDLGLLKSALGMPGATFGGEFLHPTLQEIAAAYLFHSTQNHPFVDGNKRTALVVLEFFLALNGQTLTADDVDCVVTMLALADGTLSEAELGDWTRRNSVKG